MDLILLLLPESIIVHNSSSVPFLCGQEILNEFHSFGVVALVRRLSERRVRRQFELGYGWP